MQLRVFEASLTWTLGNLACDSLSHRVSTAVMVWPSRLPISSTSIRATISDRSWRSSVRVQQIFTSAVTGAKRDLSPVCLRNRSLLAWLFTVDGVRPTVSARLLPQDKCLDTGDDLFVVDEAIEELLPIFG